MKHRGKTENHFISYDKYKGVVGRGVSYLRVGLSPGPILKYGVCDCRRYVFSCSYKAIGIQKNFFKL